MRKGEFQAMAFLAKAECQASGIEPISGRLKMREGGASTELYAAGLFEKLEKMQLQTKTPVLTISSMGPVVVTVPQSGEVFPLIQRPMPFLPGGSQTLLTGRATRTVE